MSTYTDQLNRRKENVQILRIPGNVDDGITPQRLKLINPENEYYGKFYGDFNTTSVDLSNVSVYGSKINGSELRDVTLYSGDRILDLNEVADQMSEIQQLLSDDVELSIASVNQARISAEERLETLSAELSECSSGISVAAEAKMNLLRDGLSTAHDDLSIALSTEISVGLVKLDERLSSYVDGQIKSVNDRILCAEISATGQFDEIQKINGRLDDIDLSVTDVVEGGMVWRQILTADAGSVPSTLSDLFEINGVGYDEILKKGWQYKFRPNSDAVFSGNGIRLQTGDFIFITEKTAVSAIDGSMVETFNAVDLGTVLKSELREVSGWILSNDSAISTALSHDLSSYTDDLIKTVSNDILNLSVDLSTDLSVLSSGISSDVRALDKTLQNALDISCKALYQTVERISGDISSCISSLSSNLSNEITALDSRIYGDIESLSGLLSTGIVNLSVALSNDISSLSSALSNDVDTLSSALSGQISTLNDGMLRLIDETSSLVLVSAAVSVDAASNALGEKISRLKSDLTGLSGEFGTISARITSDNETSVESLSETDRQISAAFDSTLSAVDQIGHSAGHIQTRNVMLTDIGENMDGVHVKYYMTLSAGTLVLVPMN